ncbi:uncharacterized protein [Drosophila takahashii]|uniref:uncharacterized protein isoform X2 n=1 Tax=Drosophila takahashii TaxID=29030 RepID=UPI003899291B
MRNRSGSPRKQSKQKTPEPVAVRVRLSALSTAISVTPSTTVKKSRSQPNSIDLPRHLLHLRREAMSNAMTAAHEPTIHYLDSVLSEEEKRCDYGHQWRNISISRSGRFRSKNKKRDAVDGKLFDAGSGSPKENEKVWSLLFVRTFIIAPVHCRIRVLKGRDFCERCLYALNGNDRYLNEILQTS